MYEYVGKASPFLVLATLGFFDGCKTALFSDDLLVFFSINSIAINGIKTKSLLRTNRRLVIENTY